MRILRHPRHPPPHPNSFQIHRPPPCPRTAPIQPSGHIQLTRSSPWVRGPRTIPPRTRRPQRHMVHPFPHHPPCLHQPARTPGDPSYPASPRPPQTPHPLLRHGHMPPSPSTTGCTYSPTIHNPDTDYCHTYGPMAQLPTNHLHRPPAWTRHTQYQLPGCNRICHHHRH